MEYQSNGIHDPNTNLPTWFKQSQYHRLLVLLPARLFIALVQHYRGGIFNWHLGPSAPSLCLSIIAFTFLFLTSCRWNLKGMMVHLLKFLMTMLLFSLNESFRSIWPVNIPLGLIDTYNLSQICMSVSSEQLDSRNVPTVARKARESETVVRMERQALHI
jgi:hypothetical protein